MEDHHLVLHHDHDHDQNHQNPGKSAENDNDKNSSECVERNEPVRSRWTPKPEQILVLESIFNSGMVNPPKEETVKIRKVLERFGPVGDANVFYWFQNRRSRSRRRQRQIQANLVGGGASSGGDGRGGLEHQKQQSSVGSGGIDQYQGVSYAAGGTAATSGFMPLQQSFFPVVSTTSVVGSSCCSSSSSSCSDDFFQLSAGFPAEIDQQNPSVPSTFQQGLDSPNFHYESGVITVFINGVPTEVQKGPFNMEATFGPDVVLVHSSGVPVPLDDYGFSVPGLQHGENYFLVSRSI